MTSAATSEGAAHLFNAQAAAYAQFRPVYPPELYEAIFSFANLKHKGLALDIGTGSGQCAVVLAKSFEQVLAVDPSASQLSQAVKQPNISYQQGTAEQTGVADGSVNLITVAQAYHWFDHPAFYKEVKRILKPQGTLAVWGYGLNHFGPNAPEATALLLKYYKGEIEHYWDDRRGFIDAAYKGIEPKEEDFEFTAREEIDMVKRMPIGQFIGYLSSWSAYTLFRKDNPDKPDPLPQFEKEFIAALGAADRNEEIEVIWPMFLLMAKNPKI